MAEWEGEGGGMGYGDSYESHNTTSNVKSKITANQIYMKARIVDKSQVYCILHRNIVSEINPGLCVSRCGIKHCKYAYVPLSETQITAEEPHDLNETDPHKTRFDDII